MNNHRVQQALHGMGGTSDRHRGIPIGKGDMFAAKAGWLLAACLIVGLWAGCSDSSATSNVEGQNASAASDTLRLQDGTATRDLDGAVGGSELGPEEQGDSEAPCSATGCPCEEGEDTCDDGLSCTSDECADGQCSHGMNSGSCLSEQGEPHCVAHLLEDPARTCLLCDASADGGFSWNSKADGAPCEDNDACTVDDYCELGSCEGKNALSCETDNPCVEVVCVSTSGCVETPNDGDCDDGNACTVGESCLEGLCQGGQDAGPCDDGDICTVGDLCQGGECMSGAEPLDCDDNDLCSLDTCDPVWGCVNEVGGQCDDGDVCTEDGCDSDTGACTSVPLVGPCDDGDPCTKGESCQQGGCAGGVPDDCDDDNECTTDSCDPDMGCQHFFLDGECDDGYACTVGDFCAVGVCVGNNETCPWCPLPSTENAAKVTEMQVSSDGYSGSGLDVDQNPDTCAPPEACGGGVDNALAFLSLFNGALGDAFDNGALMYLIDLDQFNEDDESFSLNVYQAYQTSDSSDAGCDFQVDVCEYSALQASFDGGCQPYFSMNDAMVTGNKIQAGNSSTIITVAFPLGGGVLLPLTIAGARFEATLTYEPGSDPKKVQGMTGRLGGAVPKSQLIETLENVDDEYLPLPKATVIEMLEELIINDIDLDGDGVHDAASIAMRLTAIGATLSD